MNKNFKGFIPIQSNPYVEIRVTLSKQFTTGALYKVKCGLAAPGTGNAYYGRKTRNSIFHPQKKNFIIVCHALSPTVLDLLLASSD